jgi:hypothetical protein
MPIQATPDAVSARRQSVYLDFDFRDFVLLFFAVLFEARFGFPLRLPLAMSRNCFSLIERAICLEGPFSLLFDVLPRFADSAAPAAFCCDLDLAGIGSSPWLGTRIQ